MTNKIKVASLFSGCGGFEQGIYQALGRENVEVVFASEIDKFASKSYEIMHGHTPYGDITKVDFGSVPNIKEIDLLVGGSPCQSFSVAGKRGGFSDTRGTLFFEYARAVKELQPTFFIYENVKGLTNHDGGKTFETILNTFDELGYAYYFKILNSKHYGTPQNRERLFVVGGREESFSYEFPKEEPLHLAIKDILEENVDARFYLSKEQQDKFVPKEKKKESDIKIKARAYQGIYEKERRTGHQLFDVEGISPTITCSEANQIYVESKIIVEGTIGNYNSSSRILNPNGISPTIDTMGGGNREPKILVEGETGTHHQDIIYNPNGIMGTLCARDYKDPKRIIVEGNLNREGHSEHMNRIYSTEGISPTKTTRGGDIKIIIEGQVDQFQDGIVVGTEGISKCILAGNPKKLIKEEKSFRIRKLTPKECLRIQSFPDTYYDTLKEHGLSNSQLYKMAGNAVSPCVIQRLVQQLNLK